MLLQGSAATQSGAVAGRNVQAGNRAGGRSTKSQPASSTAGRSYPPIVFSTPSLGRAFADGLGGIARTTLFLVLLLAAFIGVAMVTAIAVTSVVTMLGIDASGTY